MREPRKGLLREPKFEPGPEVWGAGVVAAARHLRAGWLGVHFPDGKTKVQFTECGGAVEGEQLGLMATSAGAGLQKEPSGRTQTWS